MVYTLDIGVYIYTYIKMCTPNFVWVLYFQQIGKLPKFFQNHTGDIIFSKMAPNFTVLEGIFETQFQI